VVVQNTFTDYQYPHGECDQGDCGYMTAHFNAGPQHMDGATALVYARSRHSGDNGEGTDFARSRRQQIVLQALKQKMVSVNGIAKLPDVLGALGGHVITDLGIGDSKSLYNLVKDVDPASIARVSVDDTNFLYECGYPSNCSASYLYTHDTTYQSIQHFVNNVLPPPAAVAEKAPVTVIDAGGRGNGAAGRWSTLLGGIHLNAKDGGTRAASQTTHVVVTGGGTGAAQTAQYLSTLFNVPVETATAAAGVATVSPSARAAATPRASPAAPAGVTVILGADEERSFNHDVAGYYGGGTGGSGSVQATQRPTQAATAAPTETSVPATPAPSPSGFVPPTAIPTPSPPPVTPTPKPSHTPTPVPSPSSGGGGGG
jgi:LytR_cpsA_psr family